MFHFQLDRRTQAHLRVVQRSADMAELLRQRGLCVGFLGRIDPQIEQRAGVGDLATGLFMRSQLGCLLYTSRCV